MTWGWDFSTISPTNFREGSGFLGNVKLVWGPVVWILGIFLPKGLLLRGQSQTTNLPLVDWRTKPRHSNGAGLFDGFSKVLFPIPAKNRNSLRDAFSFTCKKSYTEDTSKMQ